MVRPWLWVDVLLRLLSPREYYERAGNINIVLNLADPHRHPPQRALAENQKIASQGSRYRGNPQLTAPGQVMIKSYHFCFYILVDLWQIDLN